MGEIFDFISGKTTALEGYKKIISAKKKYLKRALKGYESDNLDGWINERAELDLAPHDKVKKYKIDLKNWFYDMKEAFNTYVDKNYKVGGFWGNLPWLDEKDAKKFMNAIKMTDEDFPLLYYANLNTELLEEIGYKNLDPRNYGCEPGKSIFIPSDRFYEGINACIKAMQNCPNPVDYETDRYRYDGYDRTGYNKDGFDRKGYNKKGYDKDGYDVNGYDRNGYDKKGYNKNGFDRNGYDRKGYDRDGYDKDGYDSSGYDSDGYDIFGNHEDFDY